MIVEDRTGHYGIEIDGDRALMGWLLRKEADGTWTSVRKATRKELKDARNSHHLKIPICLIGAV